MTSSRYIDIIGEFYKYAIAYTVHTRWDWALEKDSLISLLVVTTASWILCAITSASFRTHLSSSDKLDRSDSLKQIDRRSLKLAFHVFRIHSGERSVKNDTLTVYRKESPHTVSAVLPSERTHWQHDRLISFSIMIIRMTVTAIHL